MRNIDSQVEVSGSLLYVRLIENHENRPTIVFLHDSLGCVALWRDFPCKLAEATSCNLLVYDRKGYGRSEPMQSVHRSNRYLEDEADTLNTLLLQLNITKAILFGHSDGGSIALIAAAKYPSGIEAVISEAAHIFVEQETIDGLKAAVESYRETILKSRLAKYHGEKTDAVFHAWTDTWLSEEYRTWNIEHFLPNIVCPTLIIQGEKDEYGTMKQVQGIAGQVQGRAETFILPGLGHTPHKEAPLEIIRKAKQFIETLLA
ncbi:MAG TPA: alpha/beta hydrolase [Flavisolibacter sp.]